MKGESLIYIQLLRDEKKHSEDDVEIYKMKNSEFIIGIIRFQSLKEWALWIKGHNRCLECEHLEYIKLIKY